MQRIPRIQIQKPRIPMKIKTLSSEVIGLRSDITMRQALQQTRTRQLGRRQQRLEHRLSRDDLTNRQRDRTERRLGRVERRLEHKTDASSPRPERAQAIYEAAAGRTGQRARRDAPTGKEPRTDSGMKEGQGSARVEARRVEREAKGTAGSDETPPPLRRGQTRQGGQAQRHNKAIQAKAGEAIIPGTTTDRLSLLMEITAAEAVTGVRAAMKGVLMVKEAKVTATKGKECSW